MRWRSFASAASSSFCCHATRASNAASATFLQNCAVSDSRESAAAGSAPGFAMAAVVNGNSGCGLAGDGSGLAARRCGAGRNLVNSTRFSGFDGFAEGLAGCGGGAGSAHAGSCADSTTLPASSIFFDNFAKPSIHSLAQNLHERCTSKLARR